MNDKAWIRAHRVEALSEQGGICRYCRSRLTIRTVTADHRLAKSRGGTNERHNIVAACAPCNSAKGSMSESKFLSLIKKPPAVTASFAVMRAWMRRKIALRTERACKTIEAMVS